MKEAINDIQYGNNVRLMAFFGPDMTYPHTTDITYQVIKMGQVTYQKKANLLSGVGTMTLEIDSEEMPTCGTMVFIYSMVNYTSITLLLTGQVAEASIDPVTKTVNISIENVRSLEHEIQARAMSVDYPFMLNDGPDMPIVFGSGVKYPVSESFPRNKLTLQTPVDSTVTSCLIDGGDQEVQGTSLDIIIGGIVLEGSFAGDEFTITDFNKAYYTGLTLVPG